MKTTKNREVIVVEKDIFFKEASELQEKYQALIDERKFTNKNMCELCVPFRDKYGLTDLQTLRIARKEMDFLEVIALLEKVGD